MSSNSNTTDSDSNGDSSFNTESSKLLLDVLQKEFSSEEDRKKGLQSRAGIFISLIGVMLPILFSNINISKVVTAEVYTFPDIALFSTFILLILIIFIGLAISLICFVFILSANKYTRIGLSIFSEEGTSLPLDLVTSSIIESYTKALNTNITINDKKVKSFQIGYIVLTVCILLTPILIPINSIL